MLYQAIVKTPWYDIGGRKYLDLELDGHIRRVKVPFRYGRVMCHVNGHVPVQDLKEGQSVQCFIERKAWEGETYMILHSITT